MTVTSAGVLLYRTDDAGVLQLWIVHMGGPFWARKDEAAWSIPKGEYAEGEDPYVAALREFEEEIGAPPPAVEYELLGEFRQPSRKLITVYAAEVSEDVTFVESNTFARRRPDELPGTGTPPLGPRRRVSRGVGRARRGSGETVVNPPVRCGNPEAT